MPILHLANTSFELELAEESIPDISASIQSHPIFMQLQFLPLLYAGAEDGLAVTHPPIPSFERPQGEMNFCFTSCRDGFFKIMFAATYDNIINFVFLLQLF